MIIMLHECTHIVVVGWDSPLLVLSVQVSELGVQGRFVVEKRDGHVESTVDTGDMGLEGR